MATKTTNEQVITIPALDIRTATVKIVGDSPLIMHRWSEKAKKEILDKQMKKAKSKGRDASAPLHGCFEWDDAVAAEKYRVHQAGDIIRALVVSEEKGEEPHDTRAFVHVRSDYHPISVVVDDAAMLAELLASAEKEMMAFQRKYETLQELSSVMDAILAYQKKTA